LADGKENEMNLDRRENYGNRFKASADEQPWDELATDEQIVNSIRETYGIANDETECQVTDWQARLK
jgi:hypothetical protein